MIESYLPDRAFVYRSTETELFIHTRHDVSEVVNATIDGYSSSRLFANGKGESLLFSALLLSYY